MYSKSYLSYWTFQHLFQVFQHCYNLSIIYFICPTQQDFSSSIPTANPIKFTSCSITSRFIVLICFFGLIRVNYNVKMLAILKPSVKLYNRVFLLLVSFAVTKQPSDLNKSFSILQILMKVKIFSFAWAFLHHSFKLW